MTEAARSAHILFVEDNIADQIVTKRALKKAKVINTISVFEKAESALESLRSGAE